MDRDSYMESQLTEGEYDEKAHLFSQDEELLGFVEDKIRWTSSKMTGQTPFLQPKSSGARAGRFKLSQINLND